MRTRNLKPLGRRQRRERDQETSPIPAEGTIANERLSRNVEENEQILRSIFEDCSDVVFRPIRFDGETKLLVVYIDGVNDTKILDEAILKPILFEAAKRTDNPRGLAQLIRDQFVPVAQTTLVSTMQELVESIVKCTVAIVLDGENVALTAEIRALATRAVEEPAQ